MNDVTAVAVPGRLEAIPDREDPRIAECRKLLSDAATHEFVEVYVVGIRARGTGFSHFGTTVRDPVRLLGAIEVSKRDIMAAMGAPSTEPPKEGA